LDCRIEGWARKEAAAKMAAAGEVSQSSVTRLPQETALKHELRY